MLWFFHKNLTLCQVILSSWSQSKQDVLQENHELLLRCIKENLGFKEAKPVAACVIYKCLLHWHAFEAERTAIFDFIIEGINNVLRVRSWFFYLYFLWALLRLKYKSCWFFIHMFQVDNEHDNLPYWLSNTSALLCLLQRNLRSNGFLATPRRSGSLGLNRRNVQVSYQQQPNFFLATGWIFLSWKPMWLLNHCLPKMVLSNWIFLITTFPE